MATALVLADDGRRENGRWKRGSVDIQESLNSGQWRNLISQAGTILDYRPDLAADVIAGETALDAAYRQAVAARDETERKAEREARLAAEEAEAGYQVRYRYRT